MRVSRSRKRILLIVEMSRSHGRGIAEGISIYTTQHTDWLVNFESRSVFERNPDWLKNWSVDGVISRSASKRLENSISAMKIPYVELFRDGPGDVESDGDLVGKKAAQHLISRGLSQFAFYAPANIWWLDWRCRGFIDTLQAAGFEPIIYPGFKRRTKLLLPFWEQAFREDLIRWLRTLPRPIGVYSPTDILASRVLDACMSADIRVPEEIAVLGTDDDTLVCNLTSPKLSSFDLNSCQIGYEAAALLDQKLRNRNYRHESTILVPPLEVSIRQSTDILAIPDIDTAHAVRLIREFAHKGITVSEVTNQVGMTTRELERQFIKWLGHSPAKEILYSRLKIAKKLLVETDNSVELVGKKSGFPSPHYFVHVFHREEHLTPRQYRIKHRTGYADQK